MVHPDTSPVGREAAPSPDDVFVTRHPILIHDNAVVVVSVFAAESRNWLDELWTVDYLKAIKPWETGARELVDQLSDHACVAFWHALRQEIANSIDRQNERYGTHFPHDSVDVRSASDDHQD